MTVNLSINSINTYESCFVKYIITNAIIFVVGVVLIISFITMVIKLLIHKEITIKHKKCLLYLVLIIGVIFVSKLAADKIIPNYIKRANREWGEIAIDKNIPKSDVEEIINLAKTLNEGIGVYIYYYDECFRQIQNKSGIGVLGPHAHPEKSVFCQDGDIFLTIRRMSYGEYRAPIERYHYLLLRKIDNKWQVIEDLGNPKDQGQFIKETNLFYSDG